MEGVTAHVVELRCSIDTHLHERGRGEITREVRSLSLSLSLSLSPSLAPPLSLSLSLSPSLSLSLSFSRSLSLPLSLSLSLSLYIPLSLSLSPACACAAVCQCKAPLPRGKQPPHLSTAGWKRTLQPAASSKASRVESLKPGLTFNLDGQGMRVALVGRPNAGKSSLLNLLAGRDVAIVNDRPGTTRDLLHVSLDLGGFKVILTDSAGVRDTADPVEEEGVRRALQVNLSPPPISSEHSPNTHERVSVLFWFRCLLPSRHVVLSPHTPHTRLPGAGGG
jgi:hypothetical protein